MADVFVSTVFWTVLSELGSHLPFGGEAGAFLDMGFARQYHLVVVAVASAGVHPETPDFWKAFIFKVSCHTAYVDALTHCLREKFFYMHEATRLRTTTAARDPVYETTRPDAAGLQPPYRLGSDWVRTSTRRQHPELLSKKPVADGCA